MWSVRVQIAGVTTRNESDALTRLVIFGRDGFFRIDIVSDGETLLATRSELRLFTDNLRFHDGRDYNAFQLGADPVMRRGLESVLGVRVLLHAGFLDHEIEQELIMILAVGGILVTGAGAWHSPCSPPTAVATGGGGDAAGVAHVHGCLQRGGSAVRHSLISTPARTSEP